MAARGEAVKAHPRLRAAERLEEEKPMRRKRFLVRPQLAALASLVLLVDSAPAVADVQSIATDRPDFVESGSVVGKGVFQIETSAALERDRWERSTPSVWTTPTLFRLGVSERVELRLETEGFVRQRIDGGRGITTENGFANSAFGLKWQMSEGDDANGKAALAWLAHLEANSGSAAFRGSGAVPSLRLVAEWGLPGDAAFGLMPGLAWQKEDAGARYWSGILAATYSRPLGASLRGFVELAGRQLRSERRGGNQATFDIGITYALDKDTQLDAAVNLGLTRFTPDALITVGFSKRFR
jgi:hypothetical protein